MRTMRQDAWSAEDDARLASIVLRHIREGSTQLSAFGESAELLGRTAAACGYRWNACVRKLHLSAIDLAKMERKEHKERSDEKESAPEGDAQTPVDGAATWNAVFRFLKQFRHDSGVLQARVRQLEREAEMERQEGDKLRRDRLELLQELNRLAEEHEVISEHHRALLHIVETARRRSFPERGNAEREGETTADGQGALVDDTAKAGEREETAGHLGFENGDGGVSDGREQEAPARARRSLGDGERG